MWKIFAGFAVFAAVAMFVVVQGGEKVDMAGEAGSHAPSATAEAKPAATPAK